MNNRSRLIVIGIVSLLILVTVVNQNVSAQNKVPKDYGANGALRDHHITLKEALTYALEDEYLTQTRYDVVMETFGQDIEPFVQMQYANKRHIQDLYQLSRENGIPILKNNNNIVYYLEVPTTVKHALKNEISYENQNISMYDKLINRTDFSNEVKEVFRDLQEASRRHLRQLKTEFNRY